MAHFRDDFTRYTAQPTASEHKVWLLQFMAKFYISVEPRPGGGLDEAR